MSLGIFLFCGIYNLNMRCQNQRINLYSHFTFNQKRKKEEENYACHN